MTRLAQLQARLKRKVVDIRDLWLARALLPTSPMIDHDGPPDQACDPDANPERWICPVCSCYQDGPDACGCGLCPPCCNVQCDFIEDAITGERQSRCGNCD